MTTTILSDLRPTLDVERVLRGQGIDPARARPPGVAAAEEIIPEAQALLEPAALYTILAVRAIEHDRVVLQGEANLEGPLVARALAGAERVAVAVCTIGPALEERVAALFAAGDPVRAMALDGAGVAAVGEVSRLAGERICGEAADLEYRTGMRASPGQEGWPIEQQRVLFDLAPAGEIGVRLTESCLMLPRKSVSSVIGMGPDMRADATACDYCSRRTSCGWRAEKS